jgi:hypothetical protein
MPFAPSFLCFDLAELNYFNQYQLDLLVVFAFADGLFYGVLSEFYWRRKKTEGFFGKSLRDYLYFFGQRNLGLVLYGRMVGLK